MPSSDPLTAWVESADAVVTMCFCHRLDRTGNWTKISAPSCVSCRDGQDPHRMQEISATRIK